MLQAPFQRSLIWDRHSHIMEDSGTAAAPAGEQEADGDGAVFHYTNSARKSITKPTFSRSSTLTLKTNEEEMEALDAALAGTAAAAGDNTAGDGDDEETNGSTKPQNATHHASHRHRHGRSKRHSHHHHHHHGHHHHDESNAEVEMKNLRDAIESRLAALEAKPASDATESRVAKLEAELSALRTDASEKEKEQQFF